MRFIDGYKFDNQAAALSSQQQCSDYYGVPASPNSVTHQWVDVEYANLNATPFYYISADESLVPVLGQPEPLQIETPPLRLASRPSFEAASAEAVAGLQG